MTFNPEFSVDYADTEVPFVTEETEFHLEKKVNRLEEPRVIGTAYFAENTRMMWERWNTIRADGGFGPVDMNPFNHYAYGAVADRIVIPTARAETVREGDTPAVFVSGVQASAFKDDRLILHVGSGRYEFTTQ